MKKVTRGQEKEGENSFIWCLLGVTALDVWGTFENKDSYPLTF